MRLTRHIAVLLAVMMVPTCLMGQEMVDTIAASAPAEVKADTLMMAPEAIGMRVASPMPYAPVIGSYLSPYMWQLHEGFNAQFGLTLAAAFGKHAPHGVGFGQSVALAYVHPLTKKFYFAVGLTASHMAWDHNQFNEVGIGALLGYRVSERLDLYAYAEKNLLTNRSDHYYGYPWMRPPKHRIGVGMEYKVSPVFSVGLNVEHGSYDGFNPYYAPTTSLIRPYQGLDW